jgi:DNA-binding beta-propeller fold protein YncE
VLVPPKRDEVGGEDTSMRPTMRIGLAAAAIAAVLRMPSGDARAEDGALTQLPGNEGCVSQDGSGPCNDGDLLDGAFSVAVTKDGKNAYVALVDSDAVAVLARDRKTGALTQLPSPHGCISEDGSGGLCTDGKALSDPVAVAVSPDGRNVYVASFQRDPVSLSALSVFARDAKTGALTQLPDALGCLSDDGTGGLCTDGDGLAGVRSVAVSNDGRHVYVASEQSDAVAVFLRDAATGALTQPPAPLGCNSHDGSGGACQDDKALDGAHSVAASNDGKHVYVASERSMAVAAFSRDAATGALTQLPEEAGCVSEDGTGGACTDGAGLFNPIALAVSPNGRQVYVVSTIRGELAVLSRDRKTGTLTQLPPPQGCVSEDGSGGLCADGHEIADAFSVAVSPDSRHVYVASRDDDAVAVFAQKIRTGVLTQLPDPEGCIGDEGGGLCTDGRALDAPRSVAVSRDGRHVYAASQGSGAVAVLKRRK